jgi:vacuolar protein sorting-associated protein 11
LGKYGRSLLAHLPEETTTLLVDICSGAPTLSSFEQEEAPSAPTPKATTGPSYLSYLALTRGNPALGGSGETPSSPTTVTQPTIQPAGRSDSPARQDSVQEGSRTSSPRPSVITARLPPAIRRPSPQVYFGHFADHPTHFVRFLETVALRRWGQSVDETSGTAPSGHPEPLDDKSEQTAVWNTLLELHLSIAASKDSEEAQEASALRDKVVRLLQNSRLPYDPTHALIVCSTRAFTPGLVLLWEKMGMYEDVLRFWMDKDKEGSDQEASTQVLRHLTIYGPSHPHLYPLVLRFLTSNSSVLSRHTSDLAMVLEHIDREKIMPPLSIVQVLSRNGVASVGLVKQWLMERIQDSQNELQAVSTHGDPMIVVSQCFIIGSKSHQLVSR